MEDRQVSDNNSKAFKAGVTMASIHAQRTMFSYKEVGTCSTWHSDIHQAQVWTPDCNHFKWEIRRFDVWERVAGGANLNSSHVWVGEVSQGFVPEEAEVADSKEVTEEAKMTPIRSD